MADMLRELEAQLVAMQNIVHSAAWRELKGVLVASRDDALKHVTHEGNTPAQVSFYAGVLKALNDTVNWPERRVDMLAAQIQLEQQRQLDEKARAAAGERSTQRGLYEPP
jgi:hypothetical protein